jgi:hypothetical protein
MPDDPKPTPEPKLDLKGWAAPVAMFALSAVLAWQQWRGTVAPTPTPAPTPAPVVVVPVKVEPTDAIVERDGIRLDADKTKLFCDVVNAGDGSFVVSYQPIGKKRVTRTIVVSGDVVVPPIPVPPEPPKPPVPPEPPQPTGPLTILLVRESGDSTPEMAMLIRDLRTGPVADYLKSKMHALGVLDTNAKDPDGKPSPAVEEWRPHFSGLTLPALVVYDPTTKRVLSKQAITPATTATQIMEAIKKDGG